MAKYMKTEEGYQEIEIINSNKMDMNNPVGTGSFSMGRRAGSVVGIFSHAEGNSTTASGHASHAEGNSTTASGNSSHAEGVNTTASGIFSHAEGADTAASGIFSHAEGKGTTANGQSQHIQGEYNIVETNVSTDTRGKYVHIVGNGTKDSARSNAHTLDWSGNAWFAGDVYVGSTSGTNKDDGSKKLATEDYVNNNVDATLTKSGQAADAAAVGEQISSLSGKIVTTAESKVAAHNTGTDTHSDIRLLIQGLTDRLNALADSDDTTLDQLSEVVAYIKRNRSLIEAITTSKVSVADIVDNLTTNVSNKPLSAAQGVALKALIDAISVPDKLPNPNALTFTGAVTGSYDGSEPVSVEIPSGGVSSAEWTLLGEYTMLVSDRSLVIDLSQFEGITHFRIIGNFPKCSEPCGTTYIYLGTALNHTGEPKNIQNVYAFRLLAECELVDGQLYGFIGALDGWALKPAASVVINTPRDSGKNTKFKIYYANAVNDTTENTIQIWGY